MRTNHRKKTSHRRKGLTLGDFIVTAYDAYDHRKAAAIVQLAINRHMIVFRSGSHLAGR